MTLAPSSALRPGSACWTLPRGPRGRQSRRPQRWRPRRGPRHAAGAGQAAARHRRRPRAARGRSPRWTGQPVANPVAPLDLGVGRRVHQGSERGRGERVEPRDTGCWCQVHAASTRPRMAQRRSSGCLRQGRRPRSPPQCPGAPGLSGQARPVSSGGGRVRRSSAGRGRREGPPARQGLVHDSLLAGRSAGSGGRHRASYGRTGRGSVVASRSRSLPDGSSTGHSSAASLRRSDRSRTEATAGAQSAPDEGLQAVVAPRSRGAASSPRRTGRRSRR